MDFPLGVVGPTAEFDFGREFLEITAVSIEVTARVQAQQFDFCGTQSNPEPCEHGFVLLGFWSTLDKEDTRALGTVSSDGLSFSEDRSAPEASGTAIAPFSDRLGFDFLLDGQGSLTLSWNRIFFVPTRIVRPVADPAGEIFDARLILEATPVPEPSTAALTALGLVGLALRRRLGQRRWGSDQSASISRRRDNLYHDGCGR